MHERAPLPARITEERPSDAEITAIVAEPEAAGLLSIGVDAESRHT